VKAEDLAMSIERSQIRQEMLRPLDHAVNQSSLLSQKPSLQASAFSSQRLFIEVSTELLRQGQTVRFKAPGRSMNPTIKEGETITIQPAAPSAVSKGDIILYSFERGFIAHRVLRILRRKGDAPCFIMRGDASDATDYPVAAQQVLGKVISVEREGRSIDLYNKRARIRHIAHKWGSRLKMLILRMLKVTLGIGLIYGSLR
jgi:signal peptidase I